MDEEIEPSPGAAMLPIALAVLAIALGAAGLYFGINASQQLTPLTDSVDAGTSSAARLEKQLASIETRLTELTVSSEQLEQTVERLRIYGSQNEQTLKQVAAAARSNRQEIVTLAEKMKELAAGVATGGTIPQPSIGPGSAVNQRQTSGGRADPRAELPDRAADTPTAADTATAAGSYQIQAGDTFAKIAAERGIRLNALLEANPDVDTRRLQIGQAIQLPPADE